MEDLTGMNRRIGIFCEKCRQVVCQCKANEDALNEALNSVPKATYHFKMGMLTSEDWKALKDDIIKEYLQSQKVIKAKALRKKGTDEWYKYDSYRMSYIISDMPEPNGFIITNVDILPADAELIDIQILIHDPTANSLESPAELWGFPHL